VIEKVKVFKGFGSFTGKFFLASNSEAKNKNWKKLSALLFRQNRICKSNRLAELSLLLSDGLAVCN
jgi:hypothetical protein